MKKCLSAMLMAVPFLLGVIGYLQAEPHAYLDAFYSAIRLYGMECDAEHPTFLLELARWTAPLATATAFFWVLHTISQTLQTKCALHRQDTIVIYGDSTAAHYLEENINHAAHRRRALLAKQFFPARTYLFMADQDEENLLQFSEWLERFPPESKIYLRLEDFSEHTLEYGQLDLCVFGLSERLAQHYWQEQASWICTACRTSSAENPVRIGLVGDGISAEKLLYHGLLSNLYAVEQAMEYHLFGNWEEYQALHQDWNNIAGPGDRVIFHTGPWYRHVSLLPEMGRLIICDDDQRQNLHIAQRIQTLLPGCTLDLLIRDDHLLHTAILPRSISLFGSYNRLCTETGILQDALLSQAKAQHAAYCAAHPDQATPWEALDAFTRYSNVSSSFFERVNVPLIRMANDNRSQEQVRELLSELEHIRWCRYHYLSNWSYKPGKKDRAARTHSDLIPYKQLSKEDQQKDWDALQH